MCLNDVDYGQLAGAVEDIHNLLSIFAEWFEESHKANLLSGNRLIWHHLGAWGNLCALFVSR